MSAPLPDAPSTAFPATAGALRAAFADTPLDVASFAQPLTRCALSACGGTCCTEGVTLNPEEAMVLRGVVRREGATLRALAPAMPDVPIVDVPRDDADDAASELDDDDDPPARTVRVPRRYHGVVADYPAHFADAACAFLMPDARCALQALAEQRDRPAWYWKPLACWLHPIALGDDAIRLPDASTDRHPGGFASRTPCGRATPLGRPAHEILAPELRTLGALLGRDLVREARGG